MSPAGSEHAADEITFIFDLPVRTTCVNLVIPGADGGVSRNSLAPAQSCNLEQSRGALGSAFGIHPLDASLLRDSLKTDGYLHLPYFYGDLTKFARPRDQPRRALTPSTHVPSNRRRILIIYIRLREFLVNQIIMEGK